MSVYWISKSHEEYIIWVKTMCILALFLSYNNILIGRGKNSGEKRRKKGSSIDIADGEKMRILVDIIIETKAFT